MLRIFKIIYFGYFELYAVILLIIIILYTIGKVNFIFLCDCDLVPLPLSALLASGNHYYALYF